MRQKLVVLVVLAFAVSGSWPASPAVAEPDTNGVYPMVFPVQGPNTWSPNFGACRDGCARSHEGQDIMVFGVKGVPVVAAAAGTVTWISPSQSACCYLGIRHSDGWVTRYIHLNNDTPGTDDGQTWGIAPGIAHGTIVEAGQLIGWVGDSGNAEGTAPHLHFELRSPSNVAIDPAPSLLAAQPVPNQDPPCPEGVECDTAAFQDAGGRFTLWSELVWGASQTLFYYGNPGDVAFSGDWDGDGVDTLGLYRRSDGYVYLRNSNTEGVADISFYFGNPGDLPIAGDFDGDGVDTVSIYRPSEARFYIINQLGSNDTGLGAAEYSFLFGNHGDQPFVGDFNGDQIDTIGLHRETSGLVYFRDSNTEGVADYEFIYGNPGDKLVAGDWDGDGDDTVGVYRRSDGRFYLKMDNTVGIADVVLYAGTKTSVVAIAP